MSNLSNRMRLAFLVLAAGAFTAACSWSVPADPGLNSRVRSGSNWVLAGTASGTAPEPLRIDPAAADDMGARDIYLRKCSHCHEPIQPAALPAGAWPGMVQKYGPRAGLFGGERQRVLAWLMANAR